MLQFGIVLQVVVVQLSLAVKYPNYIVGTPHVTCESEQIVIKVKTSLSNPSHMYADEQSGNPTCVTRNVNRIGIPLGKCGMVTEKSSNPVAMVYRICVTVQVHPLFETDNDRSYCAQCVYMNSNVINNLQQSLAVSSATPSNLEPQFDTQSSKPNCAYEIRRFSVDGPLIHYAMLGESVFHVWKCTDENLRILVQNCYVEDGEGNRIRLIDHRGCGVDQYILPTPIYSNDWRTASQPPANCSSIVPDQAVTEVNTVTSRINSVVSGPEAPAMQAQSNAAVTVTTDSSEYENSDESEAAPPSIMPNDEREHTINSQMKSDNERIRRDGVSLIDPKKTGRSQNVSSLDVSGTLMIFDSYDDITQFENEQKSTRATSIENWRCMPQGTFLLMVLGLVALASILLMIIVIYAIYSSNKKRQWYLAK